jgi:hypothetical protein
MCYLHNLAYANSPFVILLLSFLGDYLLALVVDSWGADRLFYGECYLGVLCTTYKPQNLCNIAVGTCICIPKCTRFVL